MMRKGVVCLLLFLALDPVLASPALPAEPTGQHVRLSEEVLSRLSDLLMVEQEAPQFSKVWPVLALPRLSFALRVWRSVRSGADDAGALCVLNTAKAQGISARTLPVDLAKLVARCALSRAGREESPETVVSLVQLEGSGGEGDDNGEGTGGEDDSEGRHEDEGEDADKGKEQPPSPEKKSADAPQPVAQDPLAKYRPVQSGRGLKAAPTDPAGILHKHTRFVAFSLILALLCGAAITFIVGMHYGGWRVPAYGWENGSQTQINITGVWLNMISVFTLLSLTFVVKFYQAHKRAVALTLFHEPFNSSGSMDEGIAMMKRFQMQYSLPTFVDAQRDVVETVRYASPPLTFEEWNDPERDQDLPDAIRVLIKFFYVDRMAMNELGNRDVHFHQPDNVDALLHMAYEFRVLLKNYRAAKRGSDKELTRKLNAELHELQLKLTKDLLPSWSNLRRKLDFDDEVADTNSALEETAGWGGFLLAAGMLVSQVYGFLDRSPECPPLNNVDLSIKQRQMRVRTDFAEAPMPYTYNAIRFTCTHGNTINSEEGATCSLLCKPGFTQMYGMTICDSLGGGGMAWSHLNEGVARIGPGQSFLDMASCCVGGPKADILGQFHVTMDGTTAWFAWDADVGFAHACGSQQAVVMQSCAYNPADIGSVMTPEEACSLYCEDANAANCKSSTNAKIVPSDKWALLDSGDTSSPEYAELTKFFGVLLSFANGEAPAGSFIGSIQSVPVVSSTAKVLFRIGVENRFGKFFGDWKAATPAA